MSHVREAVKRGYFTVMRRRNATRYGRNAALLRAMETLRVCIGVNYPQHAILRGRNAILRGHNAILRGRNVTLLCAMDALPVCIDVKYIHKMVKYVTP